MQWPTVAKTETHEVITYLLTRLPHGESRVIHRFPNHDRSDLDRGKDQGKNRANQPYYRSGIIANETYFLSSDLLFYFQLIVRAIDLVGS